MISIRDEYAPLFGRQQLTLWTGDFASEYLGDAWELPGHDGYMITRRHSTAKIRVECPAPRTDDNYQTVDAAIERAVTEGSVPA